MQNWSESEVPQRATGRQVPSEATLLVNKSKQASFAITSVEMPMKILIITDKLKVHVMPQH